VEELQAQKKSDIGHAVIDYDSYPQHIFEHSYVTGVLGLHLPLTESAPYSSQYRKLIVEEHLLLEGFFDDFKKMGSQLKDFGLGLRFVIEDPSRIKAFSKAVMEGVANLYDKIMAWAEGTLKFLKEIVQHWKPAEKIAGAIKKIWEAVKSLWEATETMTGWKKALTVIATAAGIKYIWTQIQEDDDGWSDMTDEEKGEYLGNLMDSMKGDLKTIAGESVVYTPSLVTALYATESDERLDEFLKGLKDKAKKAKDKVSGKKAAAEDWLENLPGDLKKETEKRLASLKDIAKKIGGKILKGLAIDAILGAVSGGIATFMKYLLKAFKSMKMVMSVVSGPMSEFVSQIKDKKKEEAEANKGKDDPTEKKSEKSDKNESYDFSTDMKQTLASHHRINYDDIA